MIAQLGNRISPAAMEAIKAKYGYLDQPLWQQFLDYLKGVLTWDFGISVKFYPQTVAQVLDRSIGWTLLLVGTATIFSFCVGSLFGVIAAWRRGGRFDSLVSPVAVIMLALPPIVVALIALYVFGVSLRWLPLGYAWDPGIDPSFSFDYIGSVLYHAVLPVATLSVCLIGDFQSTMRSNIINLLGEDYILMGMAKGLKDRRVMLSYGARNALLPSFTSLAISLGAIFSGSIVTEIVFNYPGLGNTLYRASISRDYPVIQGQLLIMTIATLAANLIVDLAYAWLDPRLRKA
jgi:peptide/nickel transport system permease protein